MTDRTWLATSVLQERILVALRASKSLAKEPDNFLERVLKGCRYSPESLHQATGAIYRSVFYSCSQDLDVDRRERRKLTELSRILDFDEENEAELQYKTGLALYKKRFRDVVADGEVTANEQASLDAIARFFDLKKRDINRAISAQALAHYSFVLADAVKDHILSDDEMAELAAIAKRYGCNRRSAMRRFERQVVSVVDVRDRVVGFLFGFDGFETRTTDH